VQFLRVRRLSLVSEMLALCGSFRPLVTHLVHMSRMNGTAISALPSVGSSVKKVGEERKEFRDRQSMENNQVLATTLHGVARTRPAGKYPAEKGWGPVCDRLNNYKS
jgi:hypothetical protein